ncbi:hypothetical protein OHA77_24680 [Streptosporangium sp. NBC_01639]|uniref:hypothetical protein n=1 Tax=Streptosporangium sp. NBC_01639 TaxID=2975948 RepID=UPI00386B4D34|nr:hypothetical protein OHA77_24680 [Streptosporangium sp. NBC_01639]
MTDPVAPSVERSHPVDELFTGAASALWATTYSVDLSLFNEFLLPRLGEPPLNVVVLADHRRLTASLDRLPADAVDALAAVNRRWLLRGVRPSGQAFHPKTYLAVAGTRVTLLVGSGNLSMTGLDRGREVFTSFRSGTPIGDAAIASWRTWVRRVVGLVDDTVLAQRLLDLEARLATKPAGTPAVASPMLHNLDTSLAAQLKTILAEQAPSGIDELLLSAPYYDDDAEAVGRLLADLRPRHVRIFLTSDTSVNGDRLKDQLYVGGTTADVLMYQPDEFVHAKLVGAIAGSQGWLLSGSANLSRAALTRTVGRGGNVEVAVLTKLTADEIRAIFTPPETTAIGVDLDQLKSWSFRPEPEQAAPAVRLISAAAEDSGRVRVASEPTAEPDWLLDDLTQRQPLTLDPTGKAVTAGPLAGRLVRLIDADGSILSNQVVVDNTSALSAALTDTARPGNDLPDGLTAGDLDTPLGQVLAWLHRNLVMEVSEKVTPASAGSLAADEETEQSGDDLWGRLEREQLGRDPRASRYGRMWSDTLDGSEPIIELLDALRARTPSEAATGRTGHSLLERLLDEPIDAEDGKREAEEDAKPRRWQLAARVRVRARNLLRRWADAQTDPRLVWVEPLAPAGNFTMIVGALAKLNLAAARTPDHVALTEDDLDDLWLQWLGVFAGDGIHAGWLNQVDQNTRANAQRRLPAWLPEAAAALSWLTVRPGPAHRERIVQAQPLIIAALNHDLLDPTDETARYLSTITGHIVTCTEINQQLVDAATYIDDDLWCTRTAAELTLEDLTLKAPPGAAAIEVRLDVQGITDPLFDPRLPRLLAATRQYRRCRGIVVYATDGSWRLSIIDGKKIAVLPGRGQRFIESTEPVSDHFLDQINMAVGVLADLFA